MFVRVWLLVLAVTLCVSASAPPAAQGDGASLRGALRALQRRRRAPTSDYSPLVLDKTEHLSNKEKFLNYISKDEDYLNDGADNYYQNTPFRERNKQLKSHNTKRSQIKQRYQPEELKNIILHELRLEEAEKEQQEEEEEEELIRAQDRSDAEYAELLEALWEKYKYKHPETYQDVTRKYKVIKKRQIPGAYTPTGGWGPVAFKRKRSSKQRLDTPDIPNDFLYSLKFVSQNDPSVLENLKDDKMVDEEDDSDVSKVIFREPDPRFPAFDLPTPKSADTENSDDYLLSLQSDTNAESPDQMLQQDNELIYDGLKEKRFPVSKRSNSPFKVKRNLRSNKNKMYRSAGTDPRVMKELSSIFGDSETNNPAKLLSQPVKRSSTSSEESSHEAKPPTVTVLSHHHENHTNHHDHDHNDTNHEQRHHDHESKPPLLSSSDDVDHSHEIKESKVDFGDEEETHIKLEHPIVLKKKSIDWSNYFGLDKRKKKSVNNVNNKMLTDEYLNRAQQFMNEYRDKKQQQAKALALKELFSQQDKRDPKQTEQIKLDSMDNKLKSMESVIVNDALQYSGGDEGLDTKEEQQIKEKVLSRLAAAYSLEKMRKALKEFKMSLQMQRDAMKSKSSGEAEMDKEKRLLLKQENVSNDESENEAIDDSRDGGFNGRTSIDRHYGKGYPAGICPVLDAIIRHCAGVEFRAGDNDHHILPVCTLHQICYLCGTSPPSTCDEIFLTTALPVCEDNSECISALQETVTRQQLLYEAGRFSNTYNSVCQSNTCLREPLLYVQLWIENH